MAQPLVLPWGNPGPTSPAAGCDPYPDVPHAGKKIEVLWTIHNAHSDEEPAVPAADGANTVGSLSTAKAESDHAEGQSPGAATAEGLASDHGSDEDGSDGDSDETEIWWAAEVLPSSLPDAAADQRRLRYVALDGFPEEEVEVIFGQDRTLVHKKEGQEDVLRWRYEGEVNVGPFRVRAQGPDAIITAEDLNLEMQRVQQQLKRSYEQLEAETIYNAVDKIAGVDAYGKRVLAEHAQEKLQAFMKEVVKNVGKAVTDSGSDVVQRDMVVQAMRMINDSAAQKAADAVEHRDKRAKENPHQP